MSSIITFAKKPDPRKKKTVRSSQKGGSNHLTKLSLNMREVISSINRSTAVLPSLASNNKKSEHFPSRKTCYDSTPQPQPQRLRKQYSELASPITAQRNLTVRSSSDFRSRPSNHTGYYFDLFEDVIEASPHHKQALNQILSFYVQKVQDLELQVDCLAKEQQEIHFFHTENTNLRRQIEEVQKQLDIKPNSPVKHAKRKVPRLTLHHSMETFQDEFMRKVDEFSPSWRAGIKLHKVPSE